jgi:NAD(P)-dependent dehydrogenase (short-subunit alcohol dehydrogenase family)
MPSFPIICGVCCVRKEGVCLTEQEINLRGRVAVVTGAARGIGKAVSLTLAEAGADIVIADVLENEMRRVGEEIQNFRRKVIICRTDVSAKEEVRRLVEVTIGEFGKVDILVNNAGIAIVKPIEEFTEEEWNRVLAINLTGIFLCSQAFGMVMMKGRGGKIINIASILGKVALPMRAAYTTSKAGVIALTKALAVEWAKYNIDVNAVAPGYVRTDLVQMALDEKIISEGDIIRRTPKGRLAMPEEVAEVVKFLASGRQNYITGQTIYIDGGMIAYGGW